MTITKYSYYYDDNLPVFVTLDPVDVPLLGCDDVAAARGVVLLLI